MGVDEGVRGREFSRGARWGERRGETWVGWALGKLGGCLPCHAPASLGPLLQTLQDPAAVWAEVWRGICAMHHVRLDLLANETCFPPQLSAQTTTSTISQSRSAATTMAGADAEIARFKDIMRQIDELEMEFDKVRHIRDIVKGFRARVEGLGGRLGRR